MEILQLRYFLDSANHENFSKTAEKYMVPISSVSASVRRLENELGCKLFDRSANRIMLNENGKRLQKTLCSVFFELDGAVESLGSKSKGEPREIRMLVRAMRSDITDYIIEYTKMNPQTVFKTVFDFGDEDFESYDIIIDEKSDVYSEFEGFELFNLRIRIKAASASSLVGKKLSLRNLRSEHFISLGEQSNMHRMLQRACKHAGFTPNVIAQINDIQCQEKMIESGMGIGLGRENSGNDKTCYLDVVDFDERYVVYTYFKNTASHPELSRFLDYLKAHSR